MAFAINSLVPHSTKLRPILLFPSECSQNWGESFNDWLRRVTVAYGFFCDLAIPLDIPRVALLAFARGCEADSSLFNAKEYANSNVAPKGECENNYKIKSVVDEPRWNCGVVPAGKICYV